MISNVFRSNSRVPRGRLLGALVVWAVSSLSPGWCEASAPLLKTLKPHGAQRGKAFQLTLVGEYLQTGAEISTNLPGTLSRLAAPAETGERELPLLVQLKDDAAPGLYPIRLKTEGGISNVLLFSVGTLPETVEEESLLDKPSERSNNDSPASAQKLTLPITVNGTLVGPDQDYYRFSAKAGERLVFEVDARRTGSAVDPVVQIYNTSGKNLAANNDGSAIGVDARVELTFAQAGDYFVLVHDAKYSEQDENFYRLKIGNYPYAESLFPLGWQRGKSVAVSLSGGSLRTPVRVKPDLSVASTSRFVPVSLQDSASLPFLFRIGDQPELFEPAEAGSATAPATNATPAPKEQIRPKESGKATAPKAEVAELPPSTVMNGRISRPGEVDRYKVRVTPGQHWAFEIEAAALGTSKLLGVLAVYDAQTNKRLALTELGQETGTNPFSFESSRNEVDPRLSLAIPNDVSEVVVEVEDLLGRGGPNFGYRLTASPQPPDFNVELITPYVNIPLNGSAAVEVLVSRRGYDGPIRLTIPDLPEDVVQEGGNIPAELNPPEDRRAFAPGYLTLTAKPDAKIRSFSLAVWAESVAADAPIRKLASAPGMVQAIRGTRQKSFKAPWLGPDLPAATVKPVPLKIELPKRHVRIVQGGDYSLAWKLVKSAQVAGPIRVENPRQPASIKDLRVLRRPEGTEYMEEGTFHILTTFATPPVKFDLVIDASQVVGGKAERVITSPAVTVEIVPGYRLQLFTERMEVQKGGKVELIGKVEREAGFPAVVTVKVEDPPDQVICPEVVVPADQDNFRIAIEAGQDARPGTFEVRLSSSATVPERRDKQEFKIPDLKAQLIVVPGSAVSASK
jgi:Bacterial pre-peptidase C-terminal domain